MRNCTVAHPLQIGDSPAVDVTFTLTDLGRPASPPPWAHLVPSGLLGLPWMIGRRLLFDGDRRRFRFTSA
ncbi:MAG TPA: hypothetical protein VNE16_11790 [Vicinamibacterales bacterium]|nr:hypothetical protein [Vicinamibacterales bacterium]